MGVFRPQDFEWPSTPEEDNADLGSVSDIGSDLSLGAVLGTCIITRAITGERVCDFPVDLRTTVPCAEQSASVALLRGHGGGARLQGARSTGPWAKDAEQVLGLTRRHAQRRCA